MKVYSKAHDILADMYTQLCLTGLHAKHELDLDLMIYDQRYVWWGVMEQTSCTISLKYVLTIRYDEHG